MSKSWRFSRPRFCFSADVHLPRHGARFTTECEHYISADRGLSPGDNVPSYLSVLQHFWSWHPGGTHFAIADGSVRFLSYEIDYNAYLGMSTRNGGEITGNP